MNIALLWTTVGILGVICATVSFILYFVTEERNFLKNRVTQLNKAYYELTELTSKQSGELKCVQEKLTDWASARRKPTVFRPRGKALFSVSTIALLNSSLFAVYISTWNTNETNTESTS